eukprot:scaffold134724_cov56-Attheya_sp.AAC.2
MAEAMLDAHFRANTIPDLAPLAPAPVTSNKVDESLLETRQETRQEPQTSPQKTVVIQLPPKRQKAPPGTTTLRIIEALSSAVSLDSRLAAIDEACLAFDHRVNSVHDEEILAGADSVLIKHLAFLICKQCKEEKAQARQKADSSDCNHHNSHPNSTPELNALKLEMGRTCEAIEMIYRCSLNTVASSFSRVSSELLPFLLDIIDGEIRQRRHRTFVNSGIDQDMSNILLPDNNGEDSSSIDTDDSFMWMHMADENTKKTRGRTRSESMSNEEAGNLALRKATKILGHFASVGVTTQPMAYHKGLISTLKRVIDISNNPIIPREARLNALWVIANLACSAENMVMMVCAGLLDTLIKVSIPPSPDSDSLVENIDTLRANSIASRAILNLSWAPENKIPMSEMTKLIDALARMLNERTTHVLGSDTISILLEKRQNAAGALRNIAAAPHRNKLRLCRYKNGMLLTCLSDAARHDQDQGVRDRVFATAYNLACFDTAEIIVKHWTFMEMLVKEAAIISPETPTTAKGRDSTSMACRALRVLEMSISEDMETFDTLHCYLERAHPRENETDAEISSHEIPKQIHVESSAEARA